MTSSVEVAVTHQIKIGRESAWVKVGVATDYDPSEVDVESMIDLSSDIVNKKVLEVIETTVETVENYEKGIK